MIVVCWHPNCAKHLNRGDVVCSRHWRDLPKDLQQQVNAATSVEKELGRPLHQKVLRYFQSRMIGKHEVFKCRGRRCNADIVMLKGRQKDGRPFKAVVNAETVEPDDVLFDRDKHVTHFATCPNAEDFRR